MSLETQGKQTLGRDIPGFLPGYPGVPEKFKKNKFVYSCGPHSKRIIKDTVTDTILSEICPYHYSYSCREMVSNCFGGNFGAHGIVGSEFRM